MTIAWLCNEILKLIGIGTLVAYEAKVLGFF